MRHVVDSDEVAHLWAHAAQSEARNSARNFYFSGEIIYSYGSHFPIARRVSEKLFLLTTRGYSNTTSKHICLVLRAIPDSATVFHVRDVSITFPLAHEMNYRDYLNSIHGFENEIVKARIHKTKDRLRAEQAHVIEEVNSYIKTFKMKKKLLTAASDALEALRRKERAAKKEQAIRDVELEKKNKSNICKWIKGDPKVQRHWFSSSRNYLRVKDGEVQTSGGARVSLKAAKKGFDEIRRCFANSELWIGKQEAGALKIGLYSVDKFCADGTVVIGCHKFDLPELNRFAKSQGWPIIKLPKATRELKLVS